MKVADFGGQSESASEGLALRPEAPLFCRQNSSRTNSLLPSTQIMPINRHISQLIQSQARSLAYSEAISYRCHVHRTICHHVRPRRVAATGQVPVHTQQRSAKTKSTVKLKDLPQGAVKLESYQDGAEDTPRYPTVVQGHRNNMQKFKNCVVLTRVGGFYEVPPRSLLKHLLTKSAVL